MHICTYPGCGKGFSTIGQLEKHETIKHSFDQALLAAPADPEPSSCQLIEAGCTLPPIDNPYSTTQALIANTLFNWELEQRVPQSVKQKQKDQIERHYQAKMESLQVYIDNQLQSLELDKTPSITISECPGITSFFPDALKTIDLERKFARQELGVVKPEVLQLGVSYVTTDLSTADGDNLVIKSHDECIIFPFAETVAKVMQQEDLYDAMREYQRKKAQALERSHTIDDTIASVYDGHEWRTRPFLVKHRDSYTIEFYYDDVTVTNPIGQYKRKV